MDSALPICGIDVARDVERWFGLWFSESLSRLTPAATFLRGIRREPDRYFRKRSAGIGGFRFAALQD